ncbi:MAG: DUF2065 domain-containing protein [Magnetospirillum sp.]|nr:DUF2065 domain-containing protein [Magnetospirillum sp.]
MRDFLTALCLALALEGVAYALFPGAMQRMIAAVLAMPHAHLRLFGVVAAAAGVTGVWLVRAAIVRP